jgi:taurine dioxygenase
VLRGMEGHPSVLEIVRAETDRYIFAPGWHADVTWQERPVLGAFLYGAEVPEHGGDTLFANQYLAYETLSPGMKRMLRGLRAVHSSARTYGQDAEKQTRVDLIRIDRTEAMKGRSEHPVVRVHPETGRKALFVNPGYTTAFANMSAEESKPLLEHLYAHATRPELTCRFRWRRGSLAFWDNRCSIHCPIDDYFGKRRRTWRITLQGDRPH